MAESLTYNDGDRRVSAGRPGPGGEDRGRRSAGSTSRPPRTSSTGRRGAPAARDRRCTATVAAARAPIAYPSLIDPDSPFADLCDRRRARPVPLLHPVPLPGLPQDRRTATCSGCRSRSRVSAVHRERLRILLSGMVAGDPHQGGASWAVLQYVAGLRRLGHEVVLVEPVAAARRWTPAGRGRALLRARCALLGDGAALLGRGSRDDAGDCRSRALERFAAEADLLINVSGMLRDERLLEPIPVRAFLDLDPGFNQVWQATRRGHGLRPAHALRHRGPARSGGEGCPIPTCGRSWIPTLPPVALEHWPVGRQAAPRRDAFTSVGHWRSYGSIEHEGIRYGQRAHSLRELVELPALASARFQLALGIHPDERDDLRGAAGERLGAARPARGRRHAPALRRVRPRLEGGALGRQERLRRLAQRLVQRSQRLLPGQRPARRRPGHRLQPTFLPTGEGLLAFAHRDEAASCRRRGRGGPGAPRPRRPRAGRGALRRAQGACPGCSSELGGPDRRT